MLVSIGLHNSFAETVSFQTNKEYYLEGDKVQIFGTVHGGEKGMLVGFEIKNPNNEPILIRTITLESGGNFDLQFKLPKSGSDGQYSVTINFESDGKRISETTYLNQGIPRNTENSDPKGGGCLIATATYGTELAPQVQLLREVRDNTLLSTTSGSSFIIGFNHFYYLFSPTISDWERENPLFKETIRVFITPMITTLSIMTLTSEGSELEVLGFGLSVLTLNLGIYIVVPTITIFKTKKFLKQKY